MKPLSECRLYGFVDLTWLNGRTPEFVVRQLCEGGADLIQLRAKEAPPTEVRRLGEILLKITRPAGVRLVINDYPAIAREVGADFCHLGQEDFFDAGFKNVNELRAATPALGIGLSTHKPAEAQRALSAGADYIAIGPIYATSTKPTAKPATLEYVRWAAVNVTVPWFAIGGITLQNLDEVLAAGARRICVVSAILTAPDIAARCREFKTKLENIP